MSLILEHEDVILILTVNLDPYLDGACVDLFGLVEIIELAISFFLYLPFARAVDNELYANEQAGAQA